MRHVPFVVIYLFPRVQPCNHPNHFSHEIFTLVFFLQSLMTVGTQAAVLAGLDITMLVEFQPPHDSEWGDHHHVSRAIKFLYYTTIVTAFCANILVVAQSTALAVLGSSIALRGPDGSMISATDSMYQERKPVFLAFGVGLTATVLSVISAVWLVLSPEAAIVCVSITLFTIMRMYRAWLRINRSFGFDESETVDFTDIFEGPAAIMGVSTRGSPRGWLRGRSSGMLGGSRQGERDIKQKGSTRVATDDSLSSSEGSGYDSRDRMIPSNTPSKYNKHGGGGRRRRRDAGSSSRHRDRDDYDLETGSRNSEMQTV